MKLVGYIFALSILSALACNREMVKWRLVWSDEFNYIGLPDSTKWSFKVGGNGWGNNELQFYTNADTNNAIVKNGYLNIIARKEVLGANQYTSARLVTKDKRLFNMER